MSVSKRRQQRRPMLIKPLRELMVDLLQVGNNRMIVIKEDSQGFKTRTAYAEGYLLIEDGIEQSMRYITTDGPNAEPMKGVILLKLTLAGTTICVETVYSDHYDPMGWTIGWKALGGDLRHGRKGGWSRNGLWLHKRKPTIPYIGEWLMSQGVLNSNFNESSRPF